MRNKRKIAFISPYPGADRYLDGWMSRIKTMDGVFGDHPRIYLDFQEWFPSESEPELVHADGLVEAYRLNPKSPTHMSFAARSIDLAAFAYIHTLHQCEYMLPFFDPNKMLVDIHGVVPEEELMMGSPERSEIFGRIERDIIGQARWASVVTKSMQEHYLQKYANADKVNFIHVPVFDFSALGRSRELVARTNAQRLQDPRNVAIYAGGAQVWQCVDRMLAIMAEAPVACDFEIYSHDHVRFVEMLVQHKLSPDIVKGYASKERLEEVYRYSPFGFALREPSVVNRVASPTKLCDYFAHAVIPIVDFTAIGDFESYGYEYVRYDDFMTGYLPDSATQGWMTDANVACLEAMYNDFQRGVAVVKDIIESV